MDRREEKGLTKGWQAEGIGREGRRGSKPEEGTENQVEYKGDKLVGVE